MKITWYGQACFEIVSTEGSIIYTDPYDPDKAGFKPFASQADIVIKSSSNDDFHDNDHLVPKKTNATVIDALEVSLLGGSFVSHGITFDTIEAMEHSLHPSGHPDQNAMYKFSVDGISIGHMGDMGNDFSDDQLDFFMDIDILLVFRSYRLMNCHELSGLPSPSWSFQCTSEPCATNQRTCISLPNV